MLASEIITNKLQELLGNKYALFPISHFNKNYTEARAINENGNFGYARFNTSEYGEFRKDKIVGVVTLSNPVRSNVDFYYMTTNYQIDFSVPVNTQITNRNGVLIDAPEFNFEADIDNLTGIITNKELNFNDTIKGKMTMSEPSYVMNETDGEYNYEIMRVSGLVVLTDKGSFGGNYKVEININGEYVEVDDITSFGTMYDVNSNAIQKQGKMRTEQNPVQSGWVATFTIDDIITNNAARNVLYSIIHENKEIINESALTEKLKRELPVRITTPHNNIHEFNAVVSISFQTTRNGNGSYVVTLTDDGE